jgi:hypothetical protein
MATLSGCLPARDRPHNTPFARNIEISRYRSHVPQVLRRARGAGCSTGYSAVRYIWLYELFMPHSTLLSDSYWHSALGHGTSSSTPSCIVLSAIPGLRTGQSDFDFVHRHAKVQRSRCLTTIFPARIPPGSVLILYAVHPHFSLHLSCGRGLAGYSLHLACHQRH